jgi:hypothetical protein
MVMAVSDEIGCDVYDIYCVSENQNSRQSVLAEHFWLNVETEKWLPFSDWENGSPVINKVIKYSNIYMSGFSLKDGKLPVKIQQLF